MNTSATTRPGCSLSTSSSWGSTGVSWNAPGRRDPSMPITAVTPANSATLPPTVSHISRRRSPTGWSGSKAATASSVAPITPCAANAQVAKPLLEGASRATV